jgi:hypothetical protein
MNLWEKIIEVRKSIEALSKDKQGFNFSYVTGDQILSKIKPKMDELGLILQPSTQSGQWHEHKYVSNKGKDKIDFLVWGQGSYTWINAEKPEEREVVPFAYYGQQGDDVSQAYGTALTYAERYFLLKYFGIPTDSDDPDNRRANQDNSGAPPKNNKEWTKESVIDFGKNKGKTLETIYKEDYSYITYLADKSTDSKLKAYCAKLVEHKNKAV